MSGNGIVRLSWEDVQLAADALAGRWAEALITSVYGVPQGGAVPATLVAHRLAVPLVDTHEITETTLIVDDLVDSGRTVADLAVQLRPPGGRVLFDALYRKPHSPFHWAPHALVRDGWLAFPWERDSGNPTDAVVRLLQHIGEDPEREGLLDTPKRVVKALTEMTAGYGEDPVAILNSARFHEANSDEVIMVGPFPIQSMCEHHMLPFTGHCVIAYIPGEGDDAVITGLSKLPRAAHAVMRRLQVQERATAQIADAMEQALNPRGVGVVVRAVHACAELRGVRTRTPMTTSVMRGWLRDLPAARQELMALIGKVDE